MAAGLAVLAALPGLARLELRTDGHALVPRRDPAVVYDREIRRALRVRDPMVVVVRTGDPAGIFNPSTLRQVRDLTDELRRLPGIGPADLASLATETGFRFRPGTLERRTLLDPLPETPEALAELRSDLRRIGVYDRALVSADGRSAAVVLGVPPEADRRAFYRRVREIAARHSSEVLGAPVAETLLGSHILADLGVPAAWLGDGVSGDPGLPAGLVPLSLTVMALVFLTGFRRPAAALLPLAKVGVCLAIVFGLMGWLGVPVYLTTAVLPVLLIAVGTASEVHLFRRYQARRDVRAAVEEVEMPVLQAAATTAVGFLSFAVSPLGPVRAFGLFAAAGVLLCLLGSLTVTPALLTLMRPEWVVRPPRAGRDGENAFGRLARFAGRHARGVLAMATLAALAALHGVARLEVQDSWIDGFAPGSAFARRMRDFDRQFQGAHILQVVVESKPLRLAGVVEAGVVGDRELALPVPRGIGPARLAGSWIELARAGRRWSSWVERAEARQDRLRLSWPLTAGSPAFWLEPRPGEPVRYEVRLEPLRVPSALRRVDSLEAFLAAQPGVGGVFGPAKFLKTASFLTAPDRPGSRSLPADPEEARILWRNSERVLGPERLRRLVDSEGGRGLVTVFLKDSNFIATRRLMDGLREYERRGLAPAGLRLGFAGDVAVSQALIGGVVATQVGSLALSFLGIFAVTAGLTRSVRRGLLCIVPAGLAVLLDFAAMGWLGVPLGVATSMFAGMALGVGVDSSLHLLARFSRLREAGAERMEAVARAVSEIGPAVLIDSGSSLLGFAVLLLSRVPANQRLGGLLALSLLGCFVATLLVVPAFLARPGFAALPTGPSSSASRRPAGAVRDRSATAGRCRPRTAGAAWRPRPAPGSRRGRSRAR